MIGDTDGRATPAGMRQATDPAGRTRGGDARHWGEAAYHWEYYGPPLRPAAADVQVMEAMVGHRHAHAPARALRALMLGVTPEIATMQWPEGTQLLAVDKSRAMMERVWPGDDLPKRRAVCADWFDPGFSPGPVDVVICDGVLAPLRFPREVRSLAARARAWLADDGILVMRSFVLPAQHEPPDAVLDDLRANRIESFHGFKLRLAMAMQESTESGVRVGDAFDAWVDARVDRPALLAATGWPPEALETIRPWEGKDARLSFPSAEALATVMDEHFACDDERCVAHELGERCPIARYRPRRSSRIART